jgi:site-specific DNA-methyltransferase (adenine-specific)
MIKKPKENDHCVTPDWLYMALDTEFRFDLDPCPLHGEEKQDGLALNWDGHRFFCNPPYSNIRPWVEKALRSKALTVLLLPARFDALWGQYLIDCNVEIRILRHAFTFACEGKKGTRKAKPPQGSMLAILRFDKSLPKHFPNSMVAVVRRFALK